MAERYDRMIYAFYKKDVDKLENMYTNIFCWLNGFETDALNAIANDDALFYPKTPVSKKRSYKKANNESDLPPTKKKLSIISEPEQCKKVSIDLIRIDEKSDTITPVEKPLTPVKPPRRNVSRLASINATRKFSQIVADENTDPSQLRVTLDKRGQPTITSKIGNVPKKVQAYEAKLSVDVLRNNLINVEPVAVAMNEVILESPPSSEPPIHVSSAVLTLSNKTNRTFSPRVTCSPLNINQLTKRTSRGTYLLKATSLFSIPVTSMGASRRRSSAMRIKLNANKRKSLIIRKTFLNIARKSFVEVDGVKGEEIEPMETEDCEPVSSRKSTKPVVIQDLLNATHDISKEEEQLITEEKEPVPSDDDDEEDEHRSPYTSYRRSNRSSKDERKSKSPSEIDRQESVISATPSPPPFKLQTTSTKGTGTRLTNNIRTPVLRITRLQSYMSSVKHKSSIVKTRSNLSCGSSNGSVTSQRIRSKVNTPQENELKRLEAWKLKELRAQENVRRRDELLQKRVEEHKRKREARLHKATKSRLEKEKQKIIKRQEHDEEEARRIESIARKKREQEEQERQQRENEARLIQERIEKEQQRLRDLELAKERELQARKEKLRVAREKAEEKARAKEEQRLKEEEKKLILAKKEEEEERLRLEAENISKLIAASTSLSVVCEKLDETQTCTAKPTQLLNTTVTLTEKPKQLLNTTVTLNSSTADGVSSYNMTPQRNPDLQEQLKNPDNYDIDNIKDDDSTDDEEKPKKQIPPWAEGRQLKIEAIKQSRFTLDIKEIFPFERVMPRLDLSEIFTKKKSRFFHRTSSAVWKSPPLKE